jgi:D-alanyl-lipoteichoic acid acyltransferase DltB (MBOAT superfamily)
MIITLFVFLIAGIWHGPSWNFVLFGLFHGFGLVINHLYKKFLNFNLSKYIYWFLTFNFVNISFIFFRTQDINDIIQILRKMFYIDFTFKSYFLTDILFTKFYNNFNLIVCFLLSIAVCFFFTNAYGILKNNVK